MSARVDQFQALVAAQPDNQLFRFSLAQALIAAERTVEAGVHLQACVEQKTDWMMPRILLGKILLSAGETDRARPLLASALQLAIDQDHDDPAEELRALLAGL